MGTSIPNRWMQYRALGQQVPGTPFIPFKVPLKQEICRRVPDENDWFTPSILVQRVPQLKVIIDLTATSRYYNPTEFSTKGVEHKKLMMEGQGRLPPKAKLEQFYSIVDEFLSKYPATSGSDALLGVHCTHGLNRTGYLICKYMVEKMKIDPQEAISKFEEARGHEIERKVFTNDISKKGAKSSSPKIDPQIEERLDRKINWRDRNDPDNSRNWSNFSNIGNSSQNQKSPSRSGYNSKYRTEQRRRESNIYQSPLGCDNDYHDYHYNKSRTYRSRNRYNNTDSTYTSRSNERSRRPK